MSLKQIQNKALQLPEQERAELARKLLISLEMPSEKELEQDWMAEASLRAQDLDNGVVQPIPAEEVDKKARALLKWTTPSIQRQRSSTSKVSPITNLRVQALDLSI